MSYLLGKDGLSQNQRAERSQLPDGFKVMDDRTDSLLEKTAVLCQFINYYNFQNKKQGSFHQMIAGSVIMILSAIKRFSFDAEEKRLLTITGHNFSSQHKKEKIVIDLLLNWISLYESWIVSSSLSGFSGFKLALRSDLVNQVTVNLRKPVALLYYHIQRNFKGIQTPPLSSIWHLDVPGEELEYPGRFYKSTGYKLLNSVEFLKQNISLYEDEIFNSGYNDPAIGLIMAFLKNHSTVVRTFNQRWKTYPYFYLDKILKAKPLKARPDTTFVRFVKSPEQKDLEIPAKTVFTTSDNIRFCNTDHLIINDIQLKQVWGIQEEYDPEIEPAAGLNYVTALRKVDLSNCINAPLDSPVCTIFEKKGEKNTEAENRQENSYTPVGLTICSASLLLKEGKRNITLRLVPTVPAILQFKQLIRQIQEKWQIPEQEVLYKLLGDIFYIEITSGAAWEKITSCSVSFNESDGQPAFEVKFSMDEDFPSVLPLTGSPWKTPAIRFLLNRNAWLFPYSWLKDYEFSTIRIKTEVEGLSDLQVYSELGRLDTSMPFYPFGVAPKKGSWMVLGSYEMAVKKVTSFDLTINWTNLPEHDNGFAGYFELYENGINNCSFTVEAEALKNRKWQSEAPSRTRFLFNTITEVSDEEVAPYGKLAPESRLTGIQFKNLNRQQTVPADFTYNMFTSDGLFKLRLAGPAFGFGHTCYQKTFSGALIKNIRSKKDMQLPNPPFVPQAGHITVNYTSEDEIKPGNSSGPLGSEISYIHPFMNNSPDLVPPGNTFNLIPSYNSKGNLLLGLDHVSGGETIRLFMLLSPSLREISKQQFPAIKAYYGNGFRWTALPQNNMVTDGTRNLTESGILEVILPKTLPDPETSGDHLFWLRLSIEEFIENISDVKGFYLHVANVERILPENEPSVFKPVPPSSITKAEHKIPGLAEIIQLTATAGGRKAEDREIMRIRLSERISHRNRAVSARDFERLVLEKFPQVRKVKCLPATDSKGHRPGVVTLVIIPQVAERIRMPKANSKLLLDIEEYLQHFTSLFSTVDAINPVYEFMQVKCKVTLQKTSTEGYYLRLLNREISNYIAFWEEKNEAPVFGHSVSIIDLANFIRSRNYVANVKNFSVLHLRKKGELLYELIEQREHEAAGADRGDMTSNVKILLNKHELNQKELQLVGPSYPWAILIPMENHLLVPDNEDQNQQTGIDELEIGNTFVIS